MKLNVTNLGNKITYLLIIMIVFFYPTSKEGTITTDVSDKSVYIYYAFCVLIIFLLVLQHSCSVKRTTISLGIVVFLFLSTLAGVNILSGRFAIARFLYVIISLAIFSLNYKPNLSSKFVLTSLTIITGVLCLWNWALVAKVPLIANITKETYSQFVFYTTSTFVDSGRPIFTFGIYSYCAFFYAMLFIVWAYILDKKLLDKKICYFFILNLLAFQFLLRSSTGLLLGSVMGYFFLKDLTNRKTGVIFSIIFLIAGAVFIYYQDYNWQRLIIGNSNNGFVSRYLGTLFTDNFVAISNTIIGIGYCIIDNLHITYTDSGYIVLATMGGIMLPFVMYYIVYMCINSNLERRYSVRMFMLFMLFEFALPAIIYPKALIAMAFSFITLSSLMNVDAEKERNCTNV